ncbi:MAG: RHS repeat-associated core domain-containing protein, partial [Ruegeria sp.]
RINPKGSGSGWVKVQWQVITNSTYNVRDQLTERNYGSGGVETWDYDPRRGWVTRHKYALGGTVLNRTQYTRQASGKVSRQNELRALGNYDYCYDYAGRVLVAANLNAAGETCATVDSWTPSKNNDQSFTYLKDGSIKTNTLHNGHDLTYNYNSSMAYAPVTVSPASGSNQSLAYDANGNMTQALDGKTIVYDGENRPTSVTLGGVVTRYEYGADGQRLYRIDDAGAANAAVTLYLPNMEVRDLGATETRIAYPHPNLRVVNGIASYLLRNQLDSVVLVTDQNGAEDFERVYQPFGNDFNWTLDASAVPDDKGFIGQRRDDDAELIYLNARYLDPTLGMFTQPDWLDVTLPSVGVNRFAYSHNDPVNLADPGGNVPYNPGGDTSTGWTEHENGSETYDSRTDRYSSDYLNSDGDNHHTIGEYNPDFFSEDAYGSRTRTRSHVNSGFYDRDSGYRGAQQDAVRLDGSQNAEYARNTASVAIGAASLATGVGGVVTGTRASLASEPLVAAALARAAHNTKTLQSYMARNQGLITQAKARGGFKQALDHAQRLADFARNPTVRSNMSNMSAAKIRAQQINRALKLEKDMIRNMNQSFGRIFDYLR